MASEGADGAAELARQRAEARRQRILAKQKDRLTSITGVYSSAPEPAPGPQAQVQSATASGGPPAPVGSHQATAPQYEAEEHLEPLLPTDTDLQRVQAALASANRLSETAHGDTAAATTAALLQRREAAAQAPSGAIATQTSAHAPTASPAGMGGSSMTTNSSSSRQRHDAVPSGYAPAPSSSPAAAAAAAAAATSPLDLFAQAGLPPQLAALLQAHGAGAQQPSLQAPGFLQHGAAVGAAVQATQAARLVVAVLLAYAFCNGLMEGWAPVGLPAVLLLLCTQLALVAGRLLLSPGAEQAQKGADAAGGTAAGQMPWRLRKMDVLQLVPGLRPLLEALSGWQQLLRGLSDDMAVFVLTCALLVLSQAAVLR